MQVRFNCQTFLFQAIQFNQTIQFSISMPLVLGTLPSDFSVISRTLVGMGGSYASAAAQSVYSTAPADCAYRFKCQMFYFRIQFSLSTV